MKVSRADMDLCAAVLSRRFSRFLPPVPKMPPVGWPEPGRHIHAAINHRADIKPSLEWANTLALLKLVRSNQARGAEREHPTLVDYMQAHAYGRRADPTRAQCYRRLLSRYLKPTRFTQE